MIRPHTIEPELTGPTPRPVRYRDGWATGCGLWFVRLFILPHTIAGVVVLATAIGSTGVYLGVWLFGTEYQGQVAKKSEQRGSKGRLNYNVEYVYMANGLLYIGRVSVNADEYQQVAEGDRFMVRALESAPHSDPWARLPGQAPLRDVGGKWFMALFWNCILSVFLWFLYVQPWQIRRLVRWGQATEGIVRSMSVVSGKGGKTYDLTYDYAAPGEEILGPTVYTRKMSSTRREAAAVIPGDLVTVLYDPDKPWRSVIYRLSDYRVG
jgi:hypothetical protein